MGIYLPIALTAIIPVGAFIGYFYDKWAKKQSNPEFSKRMGILLATGVIVGESLFSVLNAAMVGGTGMEAPLAIFGYGENVATGVGIIVFVLLVVSLYAGYAAKPQNKT